MKSILPIVAILLSFCLPGCGEGYYDRPDSGTTTAQVEAAKKREAALVSALTAAEAQREKAEKALAMARMALDAAKMAGAPADKTKPIEDALAFAEKHRAEAFEAVSSLKDAVAASKAEQDRLEAEGKAPSAGERDANTLGTVIKAVTAPFGGPVSAGGLLLAGLLGLVAKKKSDRADASEKREAATKTAAFKVISAIEEAKNDAALGPVGSVNFADPATKKRLSDGMGADGKALVDEGQESA